MRNNRKQVVFSDTISVRTKVSPAGTITVTVMNDTTMETLTHVFSFKDILSSTKHVKLESEASDCSEPTEGVKVSVSEDENEDANDEIQEDSDIESSENSESEV